jgi:hypothetical protein
MAHHIRPELLRFTPGKIDELRSRIASNPKEAQKLAREVGALLQSYMHESAVDEDTICVLAAVLDECGLWQHMSAEELVSKLRPQPIKGIRDAFLGTNAWDRSGR